MTPRRPVRVQGPDHVVLGRSVRELRVRRGLSQESFGQAANLHRNYVGAIERGEINPTFRILLKVSTGVQFPLSEIFGLYEERWDEWALDPLGGR